MHVDIIVSMKCNIILFAAIALLVLDKCVQNNDDMKVTIDYEFLEEFAADDGNTALE